MIRFFANAAVVTVVRPLASSAYGSYNLELPDYLDEEDFHQFDADGNELGYVAQFRPEVRTGGFARRFIRADVSVTAQDPKDLELEGKSDVDRVLSEARDQVAEDFFLESSIPSSGLGPWVPFVDFRVGDLVEVDILGRIVVLPVTRIEPVISDHSLVDWVVHVGGQLLNDEQERVASNEEVYRALIEDRRELVGLQTHTQRVEAELRRIAAEAVVSTLVEYAVSQDETTPPSDGWVTESPTREPGEYVWFRTTTTYGSGEIEVSAPALITGNDGQAGNDGEQGPPGSDGAPGAPGADGEDGQDGVSVAEIAPYFRQVSNSASTPDKPVGLSPSGWSRTEPGYVSGRTLYRSERTIYTDGSIFWSDVTEVSSYVVASTAMERAQQAIDDAKEAQEGADKAVKDSKTANDGLGELAQEVKDKIGEQGTLTQQLNNAATQKQYNDLNTRLWGDQGEINKLNTDFQSQQQAINDLNTDLWGEQGDINKLNSDYQYQQQQINDQTWDVLRAQGTQIALHNNQLKWLRWSKTVMKFGFSTVSGVDAPRNNYVETGLVDVRMNGVNGKGIEIIVRPGWSGTYAVERVSTNWANATHPGATSGETKSKVFLYDGNETVRSVSIQVWPDRGVEPREWVIPIQHHDGGDPQMTVPQGMGSDAISHKNGGISFTVKVMSDVEVQILTSSGDWVLAPSGSEIQAGTSIRPCVEETSGVVIFTEIMPQLDWDVGAPTSGRQRMEVAARTPAMNSWTTVASWTALNWDRNVSATLEFGLRWEHYRNWALVAYETRILVDGVEVDILKRNSIGGMDTWFFMSPRVTLKPGSRVQFQAYVNAIKTEERRIAYGHAEVRWG